MVNQYERAYRSWQVLNEFAASSRCVTYGQLANRIGIHHRPVRYVLDLIQNYCLEERLPPLTLLAVNQVSGLPGDGFVAWDVSNIEEG